MKNAWLSKPDECSKYMAFTTRQIWSKITIPFRRRFLGYTNILPFYKNQKQHPSKNSSLWAQHSTKTLRLMRILHLSFICIHYFPFSPKMFQAINVICKTFIIPDSIRNNDNVLETTRISADHVSTATPKINTKTNQLWIAQNQWFLI